MPRLIHALLAALIATLIVLAAYLCLFVDVLTRTTAAMPIALDNAIAREGTLTRQAAERQIAAATNKADRQMTSLRHDLFVRVDTIERDSLTQITELRRDAVQQITDTRTALVGELAKVTTPGGDTIVQAKGLLTPAQHILEVGSQNADLLGDCDHNPDCFSNRSIGTMKAVERTAGSVQKMASTIEKSTPATAAAVQSTSQNLSVIVERFAKPVSWMKGLLGTALNWAGRFLGF